MHRANDAQIVDALADIGKDLADLGAALAELLKRERRRKAAPVRRSVLSVIGIGLPANFASAGFGSNVSTCDAPPFMNRCTTRFALAGSGGFFGASGLTASPAGRRAGCRCRRAASERDQRPCPCRSATAFRAA